MTRTTTFNRRPRVPFSYSYSPKLVEVAFSEVRHRDSDPAALIIGVIQTAWHLPLFMSDRSTPPVPLIAGYMGLGILATWVFNNTRGSVLMTMLLHASFNTNAGFFGEMFAGADLVRRGWVLAAGWCVAALVVVVVAGPKHLSRKHHRQETSEGPEVATAPPRVV